MKREINTKFYFEKQNNSRGYYIQDNMVDVYVIVEGINRLDAKNRFDEIVEGRCEYCECCGPRWRCVMEDEYEDVETLLKEKGIESNYIIHFLDGSTTKVRRKPD